MYPYHLSGMKQIVVLVIDFWQGFFIDYNYTVKLQVKVQVKVAMNK